MAQLSSPTRLGLLLTLALSIYPLGSAGGVPVVWTGPTLTFTKQGSDPTNPANQDRLTPNVWLTRAGPSSGGMFNIVQESFYDFSGHTSPAGTLWATDLVPGNGNATIAASNWQQLTFTTWANAYDGPDSDLIGNITTHNAVVKLVADDIYLDLIFTGFNSSGFFEYERSTGVVPPPPTTGDYNHNNVVDAADYVIWRRTLNQSVSPSGSGADGNSNGTVDLDDYTYWRERFGNAVGSGTGVAAIPEPASIPLGLQLIAVVLYTLRWRNVTMGREATITNQTAARGGKR